MKLSDKDFEHLRNETLTEKYWEFQLGLGYVYFNESKSVRYSIPYSELGESLWEKIQGSLHQVICEKGEPNRNVKEVLEGNLRSIADGILSIVVETYEVNLAIGVPLTVLVMRKGIYKFCVNERANNNDIGDIKSFIQNKTLKSNVGHNDGHGFCITEVTNPQLIGE